MPTRAHARLFLALWPTAPVRAQIAQHRDAWHWPAKVARVRDDKLHMTLHFIGDVDRARIAELQRQLHVPFEPFELEFGEAKLWPHGIAILRPHVVPPALLRLQQVLGDALKRLELPVDTREFRPHVTLARRATEAAWPEHPPSIRWAVESYVLVESEFDARRTYTVLARHQGLADPSPGLLNE